MKILKARGGDRWYWLITKHVTSKMDVFTTHFSDDEKALVTFCFEEEAEMYFHFQLAASNDGWRVRQTSAGELVSVLYGACSDTMRVVLDPLPKRGEEEPADPLSVHRSDFLRLLLEKKEPLTCASYHPSLIGLKSW